MRLDQFTEFEKFCLYALIAEAGITDSIDPNHIEIDFHINGKPVSFKHLVKRLEETLNHNINIKAANLVLEKIKMIDDYFDAFKKVIKDIMERLGT